MITPALRGDIETLVRSVAGSGFRLRELTPVSGGDINTSLRVTGEDHSYFLKLRPSAGSAMFTAEADGLAALAQCPAIRVPGVLAVGQVADQAALLLEWLDLRPLAGDDVARRAGAALAALHRHEGPHYGWPRDNFIGPTPQANAPHDSWALFFVQRRLQPQLALAASQGHGGRLQQLGERIAERANALFLDYRPRPSLLHGDLWSGNAGIVDGPDGPRLALFDPAVHYGDREADLAMTELFGGFPLAFYAAYREAWPLDVDYERRKPLYNLYHVLNHLNLFGRGYLAQAERMAERLAMELSR
ncbi:fructosamine kinase family protein [Uliginosibacterium sp. H1]|uniref:fructosamine kinase family protein n=1 Tax=Uliginosibacterium sp. H1 TaxID=3114757 RepID=UPI002E17749A|nr:fructosamine kinase family protein [Uliginosibacterium sp. H1]